jgi:hypothetical protein
MAIGRRSHILNIKYINSICYWVYTTYSQYYGQEYSLDKGLTNHLSLLDVIMGVFLGSRIIFLYLNIGISTVKAGTMRVMGALWEVLDTSFGKTN